MKYLRQFQYGLTPLEHEVYLLAKKGLLTKDIAAARFRSVSSIKDHLTNIYRKLGILNGKKSKFEKGKKEQLILNFPSSLEIINGIPIPAPSALPKGL